MTDIRPNCQTIIDGFALPLIGSPYLWGATGATPGGSEGINRRRNAVSLVQPPRTDPANPAVFAAQCAVDGLHVCGGRWDADNGGFPGGRTANATNIDLIGYLAGLTLLDQSLWLPFFQFYSPRMQEGRTVTRQLVWGEDCRGKQHFDCVGFINYCVELFRDRSRDVQFSIDQWNSDAIGATSSVAMTSEPFPADILINATRSHIGFMVGDGTGPGDWGRVVHAEQTSVGVVTRAFNPDSWAFRRRLTPLMLGL